MDNISRRLFLKTVGAAVAGAYLLPRVSEEAEATTSPATLADFWANKAIFKVDGRVFGGSFGMHFISTWWNNGKLNAYYIVLNEANKPSAIGLAQSSDGVTFTNIGRVIPVGSSSWDKNMRSFPGVWKDGPLWYCVYEGKGDSRGDIGLAVSTNGVNWNVDSWPILVHQSSWERQNIGTPSLYKIGSTWYLFYHGFGSRSGSPDDCQVGLATGTDIRRLTRVSNNPLITTSSTGWDSGTVGKRSIIHENGYYYMIYEGSTDQPYDTARWSSGLARATSLLGPWEKCPRNPVLPVTTAGFGYDGPEWVRTPDGFLQVYFRDPSGTRRATLIAGTPVTITYEAERDFHHQQGMAESGGWSCNTAAHSPNYMIYGPYTTSIPSGSRSATFRLLVDNNTADNLKVITLDVADAGAIISSRVITRREFTAAWAYNDFTINFTARTGQLLEFRAYWHDTSYVRLDKVIIR